MAPKFKIEGKFPSQDRKFEQEMEYDSFQSKIKFLFENELPLKAGNENFLKLLLELFFKLDTFAAYSISMTSKL